MIPSKSKWIAIVTFFCFQMFFIPPATPMPSLKEKPTAVTVSQIVFEFAEKLRDKTSFDDNELNSLRNEFRSKLIEIDDGSGVDFSMVISNLIADIDALTTNRDNFLKFTERAIVNINKKGLEQLQNGMNLLDAGLEELALTKAEMDQAAINAQAVLDENKKLKDAAKELSKVTNIDLGTIELKSDNPFLYSSPKRESKTDDQIQVISVKAVIQEGVLWDIVVTANKNGRTVNYHNNFPIDLQRIRKATDFLQMEGNIEVEYILLHEVIGYNYKGDGTLFPDDVEFVLDATNKVQLIKIDDYVDVVFSIKAYTDMLGAANIESNGLAQTELTTRIKPNRVNCFNANSYFFKDIYLTATASRLDENVKYAEVDISFENLNRMKLYQRNPLTVDLAPSVFTGHFGKRLSNIEVKPFLGVSLSRVLLPDSAINTVYLPYFGIEPRVTFYMGSYVNMALFYRRIVQDISGASFEADGGTKKINSYQVEISVKTGENGTSRIFGRFGYFDMMNDDNPFVIAQLGYKVSFGEAAKKEP